MTKTMLSRQNPLLPCRGWKHRLFAGLILLLLPGVAERPMVAQQTDADASSGTTQPQPELEVTLTNDAGQLRTPDENGTFIIPLNSKTRFQAIANRDCRIVAIGLGRSNPDDGIDTCIKFYPGNEEIAVAQLTSRQTIIMPGERSFPCDELSAQIDELLTVTWTGEATVDEILDQTKQMVAHRAGSGEQLVENWHLTGGPDSKFGVAKCHLVKYAIVAPKAADRDRLMEAKWKLEKGIFMMNGQRGADPEIAEKLLDEAQPILEAALDYDDKDNREARLKLVRIKFILRRRSAAGVAEKFLAMAVEMNRTDTTEYFDLGNGLVAIHTVLGNHKRVDEVAQQLISDGIDKTNAGTSQDLRKNYARMLLAVDRPREALAQVDAAAKLVREMLDREKQPVTGFRDYEIVLCLTELRKSQILSQLGQHDKAVAIASRWLNWIKQLDPESEYVRKHSPNYPLFYLNALGYEQLASDAFAKADYQSALIQYQRATEQYQVVGRGRAEVALSMLNEASCLFQLKSPEAYGKWQKAWVQYDKATNSRGPDRPSYLVLKGKIQRENDDIDGSLESFLAARQLRNALSISGRLDAANDDYEIGLSYLARKEKNKARELFRDSLAQVIEHLDAELLFMSEGTALSYAKNIKKTLDTLVATTDPGDPDQVSETYRLTIQAKSPVSRAIARRQIVLRALEDDSGTGVKEQLISIRTRQVGIWAKNLPDESKDLFDQKRELLEHIQTLVPHLQTVGLAEEASTFGRLTESFPIDHVIVDIVELDPDRLPGAPNSVSFVTVRERGETKPKTALIPFQSRYSNAKLVESWISLMYGESFRQSRGLGLEGDVTPRAAKAAAEIQRMWNDIQAILPDSMDENSVIHLLADGSLQQLPWAAIPVAEQGYLIQKYVLVHHEFIGSVIHRYQDSTPLIPLLRDHKVLVIGGIDYGKPAADVVQRSLGSREGANPRELPALPQSHGEATATSERFSASGIMLTGGEARKSVLLEHISESDLFHFAGHGFLLSGPASANPAESFRTTIFSSSGIVLSGHQAESPLDYLLFGEEVIDLDLSRVRLVVLSGCFTGWGHRSVNDGVWGIRKAFELAGAQSTLTASLPVEDKASREFMNWFYKNLLDDEMSKAHAVAAAQRNMIDNKPEPRFWAAWTLGGDWR